MDSLSVQLGFAPGTLYGVGERGTPGWNFLLAIKDMFYHAV